MTHVRQSVIVLVAICWFTLFTTPSYAALQSLFDGKTLDSWQGDTQFWHVENGAIVGQIPAGTTLDHNTWLIWRGGEVDDFELRFQFRLTGASAANSGIQFRCQVTDVNHVSGYQADIDMGTVWLGRIYDEHGRALLVERGSRVRINEDGSREAETFAPPSTYAVLFRENDWNDYRIVAQGDHVAVYVNGTLFSEMQDSQTAEQDLHGHLAVQLHSGPETKIELRDIQLATHVMPVEEFPPFQFRLPKQLSKVVTGIVPVTQDGQALDLGFESGTLAPWEVTGDAFAGQPRREDGIAARWPGQTSQKDGEYFIAGYETQGDQGVGTMTSPPFPATHPFASCLIGGGSSHETRVEVVVVGDQHDPEQVVFTASGNNREAMRRVGVDLRAYQGRLVFVRLVDESRDGWGHLNFDDFRFHDEMPVDTQLTAGWRSTQNPVLQHLIPNPNPKAATLGNEAHPDSAKTLAQMYVPPGFSVDLVAAEPELHQPMAFTFDARGRIWVVEGFSYPQKRAAGEGLDRVLILADNNGDGTFETRTVFAEGLNLVSGMEVGMGGVWIGAAPELLFIPDRDRDDRPDSEPIVVLDGFGYADTHETLNSFMWGPDGWLYGNQGVFNESAIGKPGTPAAERTRLKAGVWRYHPVKHTFEVFAHGGSNQWGLDYDEHGQIFMTHCRSYWGQGLTTHVMQGGHYWNQVNSGYAPFISAVAPPERPGLKNYLLASARYGHGEGGAGKPGTREVYGGHSHVGTMIYLGDNWPDVYRNHLFTHNLHGHQLNHQVNERDAGGYNTRHAGYDMLFCADPQYVAVDLQCGPEGAVYSSDWYDPRHCHNPNIEHWDRGNGRIYRMKFDAAYQGYSIDYNQASDLQLVEAQLHKNDWHVRMARLVLAERAATGKLSDDAVAALKQLARQHETAERRLRGLWTLAATAQLDNQTLQNALKDTSEYVRAWAVQLAMEVMTPDDLAPHLSALAAGDSSLFVRRYLASALQRLPVQYAWPLAEQLSRQANNVTDRDLPLLLWYGVATHVPHRIDQAIVLAQSTELPGLADELLWYTAKISPAGRDHLVAELTQADATEQVRLLSLFELALRDLRGVPQPARWSAIAAGLYDAQDVRVRRAAESLGAVFADEALFRRMRMRLADGNLNDEGKTHVLSILERDHSSANLPLYLQQIDNKALRSRILPALAAYDDDRIAELLIPRLADWTEAERLAALELLCGRVSWAKALLAAVERGDLPKQFVTAYHARQIVSLDDPELVKQLVAEWGSFNRSSAEVSAEIDRTVAAYEAAPLWAFSESAGGAHFQKLCATCHQPQGQQENIAPKLAGSGSKGTRYIVENVIDPNAVVGKDYQARVVVLTDGRTVTGLIESESDSAMTLRTSTSRVTISRSEIEEIQTSPNSFMPTGLLDALNERERIELLLYVMSL